MERLSCHPSGAKNFEVAPRFVENLCAHGVAISHNWSKSEFYFVTRFIVLCRGRGGGSPLAGPSWLFIQYIFAPSLHVWKPVSVSTTSGRTIPKLRRYYCHALNRIVFCKVTIIPIISIQQCDDASAWRSLVSRPYCYYGGRMHNAV